MLQNWIADKPVPKIIPRFYVTHLFAYTKIHVCFGSLEYTWVMTHETFGFFGVLSVKQGWVITIRYQKHILLGYNQLETKYRTWALSGLIGTLEVLF